MSQLHRFDNKPCSPLVALMIGKREKEKEREREREKEREKSGSDLIWSIVEAKRSGRSFCPLFGC